jgi:hypothetical protein
MARSTRFTFFATLVVALILPAAAAAAPTAVDVRVEGKTNTIFEGPVTTDGKVVNPQTGGAHTCDGTNGGANPSPGPTPTSALDDAAIKGGFTWAGTFFDGFGDYAVERIATESQTATEFWGVFVDGAMINVGGCQQILSAGQEVLWSFDAFSKAGALKLVGGDTTQPGVPVGVTVTDTATKAPVAGVTVGNGTTNGSGVTAVSFATPGIYKVKAEKAAYIRSRALTVCVDPPVAEPCSSGDKTAPSARIDAPAIASSLSRFGFVKLSWQGDDGPSGSGVRRYRVDYRRLDKPGSQFLPVAVDTPFTSRQVAADPGGAYEFRVRAFDRAARESAPATATTLVPLDNLSHRVKLAKRGWRLLERQGAWQLSVARSAKRGASAKVAFTGTGATLVTRKLSFGGRVRLTVDGRSKVVSLRGKSKLRRTLVSTRRLKPGRHTLRITSVSRRPVEIDAIAIRP